MGRRSKPETVDLPGGVSVELPDHLTKGMPQTIKGLRDIGAEFADSLLELQNEPPVDVLRRMAASGELAQLKEKMHSLHRVYKREVQVWCEKKRREGFDEGHIQAALAGFEKSLLGALDDVSLLKLLAGELFLGRILNLCEEIVKRYKPESSDSLKAMPCRAENETQRELAALLGKDTFSMELANNLVAGFLFFKKLALCQEWGLPMGGFSKGHPVNQAAFFLEELQLRELAASDSNSAEIVNSSAQENSPLPFVDKVSLGVNPESELFDNPFEFLRFRIYFRLPNNAYSLNAAMSGTEERVFVGGIRLLDGELCFAGLPSHSLASFMELYGLKEWYDSLKRLLWFHAKNCLEKGHLEEVDVFKKYFGEACAVLLDPHGNVEAVKAIEAQKVDKPGSTSKERKGPKKPADKGISWYRVGGILRSCGCTLVSPGRRGGSHHTVKPGKKVPGKRSSASLVRPHGKSNGNEVRAAALCEVLLSVGVPYRVILTEVYGVHVSF